jgi:hypothetical protein
MPSVRVPEEFRPISMWGYFGYELLFSIPVFGLIFLLFNAFGSRNRNVRNFARSYFCFLIIIAAAAAAYYFLFRFHTVRAL